MKGLSGGTPPIVTEAMERLADRLSKPPVPLMDKAAFDALPRIQRCILTCNMPGCGNVVCTHGLLCVEHMEKMKRERSDKK